MDEEREPLTGARPAPAAAAAASSPASGSQSRPRAHSHALPATSKGMVPSPSTAAAREMAVRLPTILTLMQQCSPLELCYLAHVVDELSDRVVGRFATEQSLANRSDWLRTLLADAGPVAAAHRLLVHIPLIYRGSYQASAAVFDILSKVEWHSDPQDGDSAPGHGLGPGVPPVAFCSSCTTVFMMTLAHPAFTQQQSEVLGIRLNSLTAEGHERLAAAAAAAAATTAAAPSSHPTSRQLRVDSAGRPAKAGDPLGQVPTAPQGPSPEDHVIDVQVVDVQRQFRGRDFDFVMEVRWSNSFVGVCRRTHEQLFDFHCGLLDTYPSEAVKESRTLPPLPGVRGGGRPARVSCLSLRSDSQRFRRPCSPPIPTPLRGSSSSGRKILSLGKRSRRDLANSRRELIQEYVSQLIR
jgi:hypothetical protein